MSSNLHGENLPNEEPPGDKLPSPPLLQVESLSAGYGPETILHDLTFSLDAGVSLGIAGTSGAGKSTLALALLGLLPWLESRRGGWVRGRVLLEGKDLLALPEREARTLRGHVVALVPQSPMSALNPAVSLRRHFDEAWRAHQRTGKAALEARLATLLPEVQLAFDPAFLARHPGAISVGQAQRIVLALALLHQPALLLADEPTSALDPVTQTEIIALLRTLLSRHQTALLYISHDLLSILQVCDQLAVLDSGRLVEHLPVAALGTQPHHPALAALLRTLPAPPAILLGYRPAHHPR